MNIHLHKILKHRAVFVTGTDTDVGKTYFSALLARECVRQKIAVGVMKPVASGSVQKKNRRISADTEILKAAANVSEDWNLLTPVLYRAPLAPLCAERFEPRRFSWKKLDDAFQTLSARYSFLIVEGIGGVRVPIAPKVEASDLALRWHLPAIVVASAKLGTLNHTLLTLEHLAHKKIPVLGIVLNYWNQRNRTAQANLSFFEKQKIPVLLKISRQKSPNKFTL